MVNFYAITKILLSDIFRDHFAKQIASASDRSNRKSSTIMTAHFLDGKVVTAGEATKVVSPPPSTTKNEPPIPLSQMTQMPVLILDFAL